MNIWHEPICAQPPERRSGHLTLGDKNESPLVQATLSQYTALVKHCQPQVLTDTDHRVHASVGALF